MQIGFAAAWCLVPLVFVQDQGQRPERVAESRPAGAASISGVVIWKPNGLRKLADPDPEACVVGAGGRLANAVVALTPLQGQDLSQIPPPQVPVPVGRGAPRGPLEPGEPDLAAEPPIDEDDVVPAVTAILGVGHPISIQLPSRSARAGMPPRVRVRKNAEESARAAILAPMGAVLGWTPLPESAVQGKFLREACIMRVEISRPTKAAAYVVLVSQGEQRVTRGDGSFRFDGLPHGNYEVAVWHESGRTDVREVTLEPGRPRKIEVELR